MTDLNEINGALATLRARGTAARRLLDGADAARRERAATVNVAWAVARNGGTLVARVVGNEEYAVRVDLDRATFNCTCPDHGRVGACKHTLAVTERWVVKFARPEWERVNGERKALATALDMLDEREAALA